MKRSSMLTAVLGVAVLPGAASADACPQADDIRCLKAEDVRLTIAVNELHWTLVGRADGLRQGFMESAQRAWNEYVKTQCVLEWDLSRVGDGYQNMETLGTRDNLHCVIRLKQQRLAELKTIQARIAAARKK